MMRISAITNRVRIIAFISDNVEGGQFCCLANFNLDAPLYESYQPTLTLLGGSAPLP